MNLRSSGSLVLSKSIQGFISFKSAKGLSDRMVDSYDRLLQKWLEQVGDREIRKITAAEIIGYLSGCAQRKFPIDLAERTSRCRPRLCGMFGPRFVRSLLGLRVNCRVQK
jgi:hypothetical protein